MGPLGKPNLCSLAWYCFTTQWIRRDGTLGCYYWIIIIYGCVVGWHFKGRRNQTPSRQCWTQGSLAKIYKFCCYVVICHLRDCMIGLEPWNWLFFLYNFNEMLDNNDWKSDKSFLTRDNYKLGLDIFKEVNLNVVRKHEICKRKRGN